ncbi:Glycine/D-amino acid oxidase [Microbacterium sp. ru370.1]|uniref:FAD-dependent oxidoreductase n=1 Tax=unclassified Microbacterium TaxID=2609290 RepID=UPI00088CF6F2|nr:MULTISPECIES: FAD-dependent oxidoreductase [unclassified Microbacterium]SDO49068.1 Glycine/D-amino acid oxidase [Microbacterium sp. ru370.1]SIT82619.1 Glycine/D-amino acid oxidase [Microbacterium sp. RU1D]
MSTSLWHRDPSSIDGTPFESGARHDVVIVGAGVTGLSTAVMLAEAGVDVAVVDAGAVGEGATGTAVGMASLLQGTTLASLRKHHPAGLVRAYVDANRAGLDWLAERAADAADRRTAFTFGRGIAADPALDAVRDAAREAGLTLREDAPADLGGRTPVRALALDDQLALDPVMLARTLARTAVDVGATLHTGVRVTDVHALPTGRIETDHGALFGDTVVLATGTPITRRGLYDLKTRALRSWAIAFELEGDAEAPGGMWSEVGADGRSVLAAPPSLGRPALIVTGARHPVGSASSEVALAEGLAAWARRSLPVGAEIARWSGQDYQSHNLVPFVGGMPRGLGRLRFATGYAGWGLTNAPAAAMRLTAEIRGVSRSDRPEWMRTIGTRLTVPADLGRGIGEAARRARVAASALAGAVPAPTKRPAEGAGLVARQGLRTAAVSTIDGRTRAVTAPAPLTWNDAERTWDSPVDGSRYAPDGTRVEGAASADLGASVRG